MPLPSSSSSSSCRLRVPLLARLRLRAEVPPLSSPPPSAHPRRRRRGQSHPRRAGSLILFNNFGYLHILVLRKVNEQQLAAFQLAIKLNTYCVTKYQKSKTIKGWTRRDEGVFCPLLCHQLHAVVFFIRKTLNLSVS